MYFVRNGEIKMLNQLYISSVEDEDQNRQQQDGQ